MTRIQISAICKMQEIISLAKAGKSQNRKMTHKEFVAAMKGKRSNQHYDKVDDVAKQRWLDIVNKNKHQKGTK